MSYSVNILRRAQKELAELPPEAYARVRESVRRLADEPRPPGSLKLANREAWRLRVGSYRVIFEIDDAARMVTVLHVGHRRDVYR
ncbi:MAG TPA: type II toxin-antitoxin system RelE/ParE family toxin [Dehalococcoidia bacterium]|nr:type II toxin-antitoxin system RelE/ParE family toxin [Dehalococcoidia bacterium]